MIHNHLPWSFQICSEKMFCFQQIECQKCNKICLLGRFISTFSQVSLRITISYQNKVMELTPRCFDKVCHAYSINDDTKVIELVILTLTFTQRTLYRTFFFFAARGISDSVSHNKTEIAYNVVYCIPNSTRKHFDLDDTRRNYTSYSKLVQISTLGFDLWHRVRGGDWVEASVVSF